MTDDPSDFREPHLRRGDFLGAFAVHETEAGILVVGNRRVVGGRTVTTWDLPGGQVEPSELLHEALSRELHEELGVRPRGVTPFLFLQEGERRRGGRRVHAWRSFFFAVAAFDGELGSGVEALPWRWMSRAELTAENEVPYHDSFRSWLIGGGTLFHSVWDDDVGEIRES